MYIVHLYYIAQYISSCCFCFVVVFVYVYDIENK